MQWSYSHTQEMTQQLLAGHCDDMTVLCLFFCPITKLGSLHFSPSQKPSLSLLSTGKNNQQGDPARGSLPDLLAAHCRGTPQPWVCSEGGEGAMFAQQEAEPRVGRRCSVRQACSRLSQHCRYVLWARWVSSRALSTDRGLHSHCSPALFFKTSR